MNQEAFGLIFTGEHNPYMRDLVLSRAVAAVPFGGRYRVIDFALSDLVNTGIRNVGLIVQKNYHSMMDHLGTGKEWDLNRKRDGLFLLPPFSTKDNTGVYRGDIDAFHSIMQYVRRSSQKYLILCGSHTVFNTTFDAILKQHQETGADITIMYNEDPRFFPGDRLFRAGASPSPVYAWQFDGFHKNTGNDRGKPGTKPEKTVEILANTPN